MNNYPKNVRTPEQAKAYRESRKTQISQSKEFIKKCGQLYDTGLVQFGSDDVNRELVGIAAKAVSPSYLENPDSKELSMLLTSILTAKKVANMTDDQVIGVIKALGPNDSDKMLMEVPLLMNGMGYDPSLLNYETANKFKQIQTKYDGRESLCTQANAAISGNDFLTAMIKATFEDDYTQLKQLKKKVELTQKAYNTQQAISLLTQPNYTPDGIIIPDGIKKETSQWLIEARNTGHLTDALRSIDLTQDSQSIAEQLVSKYQQLPMSSNSLEKPTYHSFKGMQDLDYQQEAQYELNVQQTAKKAAENTLSNLSKVKDEKVRLRGARLGQEAYNLAVSNYPGFISAVANLPSYATEIELKDLAIQGFKAATKYVAKDAIRKYSTK